MATTNVARPRAGEIGKPLRRFEVWPNEVPVPVPYDPKPDQTPTSIPEPAPAREPEPVEVR